ncbi:MAG: DUF6178 family protein [Myxococcota bacterium]|nr:DUF6178 family protein [Myxococcota bacterium]
MDARPSVILRARQILQLARSDKRAAENALAALTIEDQVSLVCSAPLDLRERVLELTPAPEEVIPLLPEAEFCFTAKAIGLWDAGWILKHATPAQIVTSLDLDGWTGLVPHPDNLRSWLAALNESGEETVLKAAHALDPELIVLALRDRVDAALDPRDDEWQPPQGARTLDGQFYLIPKRPGDDLEDVVGLLRAVFQADYWLYFRMLQGVAWELQSDLEEWALRWRTGRLEDLGFPAWDEAMRIYGYIRPDERDRIPEDEEPLDVREWQLPVFMLELPATTNQAHSVFRGAAELDEEERRGFFYAFVATANRVAVADRMPLGDADTLPEAIEAAAAVVSQGLDHLAMRNGLSLTDTLRRVSIERLFRIGANLGGRKPPPRPDQNEESDPQAEPEST